MGVSEVGSADEGMLRTNRSGGGLRLLCLPLWPTVGTVARCGW